jgi:hypothetical protein
MQGDYGNVDIVNYNEDNESIYIRNNNIDLNSWGDGLGYPIGSNGKGMTVIIFRNQQFKKTIDSINIYSIGADNTKEVEICHNETEDTYTVEGEDWGGLNTPYVDLV